MWLFLTSFRIIVPTFWFYNQKRLSIRQKLAFEVHKLFCPFTSPIFSFSRRKHYSVCFRNAPSLSEPRKSIQHNSTGGTIILLGDSRAPGRTLEPTVGNNGLQMELRGECRKRVKERRKSVYYSLVKKVHIYTVIVSSDTIPCSQIIWQVHVTMLFKADLIQSIKTRQKNIFACAKHSRGQSTKLSNLESSVSKMH